MECLKLFVLPKKHKNSWGKYLCNKVRKNWLFTGSNEGGKAAANIYTVIESAKMNALNPEAYLKKVMSEILDYNSKKLHELLPWNIVPDTS